MAYKYLYKANSPVVKQAVKDLQSPQDSREFIQGAKWFLQYIQHRFEDGETELNILNEITDLGIDNSLGQKLINKVREFNSNPTQIEKVNRSNKTKGYFHLVFGILILIIALGATINSWVSTQPGDTYWFYWGGIVWGAIHIIIGIIILR